MFSDINLFITKFVFTRVCLSTGKACVAGGVHGRGCVAGGMHVGACMAGCVCGRGACMGACMLGHAWRGVPDRGACMRVWQERWPLQRAVRILLECILVLMYIHVAVPGIDQVH